jgi:flagellar M-ring protein FliF
MKTILNMTGDYFRKTSKKKLIVIGLCAASVIIAGIVGAILLNRVHYTVLYSGLSAEEAGSIKNLLDEMGVPAKVQGTDTILVSEDDADEIRIKLAADGYPNTGLNYDIFSNSSALGSTDLERQTYLQYQLQENMRATIKQMSKIKDCIVIVNLSNASSFVLTSNTTEASVSVMVSLRDGERLSTSEAKTIGEFVAKCVPNLAFENISIVDSDMNYYDILTDDSSETTGDGAYTTTQQELTERMKGILSDQVVAVLEPAVGSSNLAVSVNVVLGFDKKTTSEVQYSSPFEDGTDGIVRSSEVLSDLNTDGSAAAASGEAGTDTNGVSAPEYVSSADAGNVVSKSSSETYNYEINEVRTEIEAAQGNVEDLSVSVLINSDVDGIGDHKNEIKNLVANAIGVAPEYITVELLPFVQSSGESSFNDYLSQSEQTLQEYNRSRLIRALIIGGAVLLAAVGLLVFLLLRRKKKSRVKAAAQNPEPNPAAAAGGMKGEQAGSKVDVEGMLDKLVMNKSDETEVVEELMDKYPETVVQILRTWLTED